MPPDAVRVVLVPEQIVVVPEIVAVGIPLTVIVLLADAVQPSALVAVTV